LKFFFKYNCKSIRYVTIHNAAHSLCEITTSNKNTKDFCNIFSSRGSLIKNKNILSKVFKNLNIFLFKTNDDFIACNYANVKWFLNDASQKKLNSTYIFNATIDLIKPPFVIKSVLVPKKLRKKTKKKYLVKIVYKNENKRVRSALKQLCHYGNKFGDGNFNIRLYKSILFSFLDWKNSYLFKLKTTIFKNFFKA
jgi:hypothetical protein